MEFDQKNPILTTNRTVDSVEPQSPNPSTGTIMNPNEQLVRTFSESLDSGEIDSGEMQSRGRMQSHG